MQIIILLMNLTLHEIGDKLLINLIIIDTNY